MLEITARTLGLLSGVITLGLEVFSDPTVLIRAFFLVTEEVTVGVLALAFVFEFMFEEDDGILRNGSMETGFISLDTFDDLEVDPVL